MEDLKLQPINKHSCENLTVENKVLLQLGFKVMISIEPDMFNSWLFKVSVPYCPAIVVYYCPFCGEKLNAS